MGNSMEVTTGRLRCGSVETPKYTDRAPAIITHTPWASMEAPNALLQALLCVLLGLSH